MFNQHQSTNSGITTIPAHTHTHKKKTNKDDNKDYSLPTVSMQSVNQTRSFAVHSSTSSNFWFTYDDDLIKRAEFTQRYAHHTPGRTTLPPDVDDETLNSVLG